MLKKKKTVKKTAKKSHQLPAKRKAVLVGHELLDQAETGSATLSDEKLAELTIQELKEVANYLDPDTEGYERVGREIAGRTPERIAIASNGHRIWSYFYEKYPLRIALIIWLIIGMNTLAVKFPPAHPGAPPVGRMITFGVALLMILAFRIHEAWLESSLNGNHPGSGRHRRKLGLIVVDRQGKPLGFVRSFLRGLFRAIGINLIMVISMEFFRDNRGLHDHLFGTYVLEVHGDVSSDEISAFLDEVYGPA